MIDYCIKLPKEDEYEIGHRYPYYSCELLCSGNGLNIDRLLDISEEDNIQDNEKVLKEEKKEDINENNDEKENNKEEHNDNKEENISENDLKEEKNEDINENNDVKENNKANDNNNEEENILENDSKQEKNDIYQENLEEENRGNSEIKEQDNNVNKDEEKEKEKEKELDNKENVEKNNEKESNQLKIEKEEKLDKDEENLQKEEKYEEDINKNENEKETKMDIEDLECAKEIKMPNISLVHSVFKHIFSFLDDKPSLENTVLSGYFNKIVNYLIKTKTRMTLEYILLQRKDLISKLIQNINNISISNIISNILSALAEENSPEANEKYMIIVNESINCISKCENNTEEDINSVELICDLIINNIIFNNKIKFSKLIDADIITKFEKIFSQFYEFYEKNLTKILPLINLLTKMNKNILFNFNKKITTTENIDDSKIKMINLINAIDKTTNQFISYTSLKNDFKELIYTSFINNLTTYCIYMNNICLKIIKNQILQRSINKKKEISLLTSFSEEKIERYKYSNIIEFDYLVSAIDIYVNICNLFYEDEKKSEFIKQQIEDLISTNFFEFILEDYLKYRHNNFLSNIMIDLIKIVFDNNIAPKELILNILLIDSTNKENNKENLISLLINDLIKNTKFIYSTTENKANQLLFSTNITILNYIFSCPNPAISEILNSMEKEKFFYKYFVTNINNIFSKKLYKTDSIDSSIDKINSLGIKLGFGNTLTQSNTNIAFSLVSLNNTIDFYLKLYEKYLKGEEYEYLFDEREKKLEEIRKSSEYLKLNKQKEDELEEEEDEEEDINEINLPKPHFYNSKISEKINENEDKDNATNDSDNADESEKEDKLYNDVNYWHIDINYENMENLLNDL